MLELFRYDALMAAAASLCTCILLVLTKSWHGSFSIDSTDGIQKFHTQPTPRIGGIAIAVGVLVGFAASSHDPAAAEKRAILSAILLAGMPAFIFGLLEDLTKRVSVRARLLAMMTPLLPHQALSSDQMGLPMNQTISTPNSTIPRSLKNVR